MFLNPNIFFQYSNIIAIRALGFYFIDKRGLISSNKKRPMITILALGMASANALSSGLSYSLRHEASLSSNVNTVRVWIISLRSHFVLMDFSQNLEKGFIRTNTLFVFCDVNLL